MKRGNKAMEKLSENVKIICLQTPIWKVSCHRSIITGLLGSFNRKWQGFSMVCSESEQRQVELFTFPGETKSLRKVKLGQLAWGRSKRLYHVQKQLLCLLEFNFERILHYTEYVLRCLKTVWNFWFSESRNFGFLRLLSRNSELLL